MRPINVDPEDMADEKIFFLNTYGVPSKLELLQQSIDRKNEFEIGDEVSFDIFECIFID